MRNAITYPGQGMTHLIIEEVAPDTLIAGAAEATGIQIWHSEADPNDAPHFVPDGSLVTLKGAAANQVRMPAAMAVTIQRATGDLSVEGMADEVNLSKVGGDLLVHDLSGVVRVAAVHGDIRAVRVADLQIAGRCSGDLHCQEGQLLAVEGVSGDLRLRGGQEVRLGRIRGDVWIEEVTGPVRIAEVDGDARLADIAGAVSIEMVAGDLRASGLTGGLSATRIVGDVNLSGPFNAAVEYALTTQGDVALSLPADADARLTVRAGGRLRSDPRLTPSADGAPTFTATLGSGTGRISVNAGGDLRIRQTGAPEATSSIPGRRGGRTTSDDLIDLGERIRQQVSASLAAHGINIETGEINWSRGRAARPGRPVPPERPRPPAPPTGPVTGEELAILKMVEEGKITAADAERLLRALGA